MMLISADRCLHVTGKSEQRTCPGKKTFNDFLVPKKTLDEEIDYISAAIGDR
jgi:hypothetical protein